nr:immunoglobulin heavy chain junction region [Mus musculus]
CARDRAWYPWFAYW